MRLNRSARCSVSLLGQAMLEYLLLCSVLLLALLTPWSGQSSPAQQLLDTIVHRVRVFLWWLAVI